MTRRSSSGRVWPRLRLIEVGRDETERLRQYADILDRGGDVHESVRREVAETLRQLSRTPAAMDALRPKYEKRSLSPDLALDYVVRKELLGKATAAQVEASKVWGVSVGTVKDAFTDHGASATYRLKELVDSRVGKLERGTRNPDGSHTEILWTRERLLRAVLDDLQDYRRETRSRRKSR